MLMQLAVGTAMLLLNITIAAIAALMLELVFQRAHTWLAREPHGPKLVLSVAGVSLAVLGVITIGMWLWALLYYAVGVFPTFEHCLYFSSGIYTTLGLGDTLLPKDWRLLGGMEAANGFLTFGLLTALLIEALRQVRLKQAQTRRIDRT